MKFIGLVFLMLTCAQYGISQGKYWVFFSDKAEVKFDPFTYFSPEAIERKLSYGVPLNDETDKPINSNYISATRGFADSTGFQSRWLNAAIVYASAEGIENILNLPFVSSCRPVETIQMHPAGLEEETIAPDEPIRSFIAKQTERMQGSVFSENGMDGTGIRIAVFDIGFKHTDKNPAFEHLRNNNRIVATRDFVDKDDNVYHYHTHGTQVLSCIAGMIDSLKLGLATGAEFLLARTENNAEKFIEEENWLAAAEWADKNGVDIINSSLGYTHHRYFNDQMDGKTSLVAKAANMAARKGILVVNAAGNEGSGNWHYVGTPADADSVLSIGGISPERDFHINFSSFGPTADRRMKPNLCAFGKVIAANKDSVYYTQGTSFSSPLVAGFAACAWQTNRSWDNMTLFKQLEMSGELYPYFDYAHGYGVPQASYFTDKEKQADKSTFTFVETADRLHVMIEPEILSQLNEHYNLLFYNFQDISGVLSTYAVVDVYSEKALSIDRKHLLPGTIVNVWFRNHFKSYTIQ